MGKEYYILNISEDFMPAIDQITVDQIKLIDDARQKLFDCTTEQEVKNVFTNFNISAFDVRITLLRRCMQIKNVYGNPGNSSENDEDLYKEELAFFVDGQWRELI